jgi:pyruvate dehydrogenase E2 component (dihydrolipoamide acetyltransferase)
VPDVLMPRLGMTMTEGTVVQWLKKPGEFVEKGEFLFIVQTDKVDIEIESTCSGKFTEILVELGQVVPIGTPIGRIAQESDERRELPHYPTTPKSAEVMLQRLPATPRGATSDTEITTVPSHSPERMLANPRAKRLARELGLDISLVPDYERRGRVVEADVRRFFEERASAPSSSENLSSGRPDGTSEKAPASYARNATAERMTAAFRTVPHFYLTVMADATKLCDLKETMGCEIGQKTDVRPTFTDLLMKALALALRAHPEVNAYWQSGVVRRDRIDVGFAAQISDRLVVPVVRNADKLPLAELARARDALVRRAQAGKLRVDDVGDASCTLSNLGSYGIDTFQAIINPPESVIVAIGRIAARPMVVAEAVVPRQTMHISVSADHRLIDGTTGARFLRTLVGIVESPNVALRS